MLLANTTSIAIVLAAVIIVQNIADIVNIALAAASAIKFCNCKCVQKHCYQGEGGRSSVRTQVHSGAGGAGAAWEESLSL